MIQKEATFSNWWLTSREMLLSMMLFLTLYLQIGCPAAEHLAGELGNSGQEQAYQPLRADCCSPRWSSPRCQELRHVLGVSSNQFESFHNNFQFSLQHKFNEVKGGFCVISKIKETWFSTSQSTFIMNIFQEYCSFNCVLSTMLGLNMAIFVGFGIP